MAKALRCDICGKVSDLEFGFINPDTRPNRIELLLISNRSLEGDKLESYDVCKKCCDDICGFIIDMRVDNMKRVKDEQTY